MRKDPHNLQIFTVNIHKYNRDFYPVITFKIYPQEITLNCVDKILALGVNLVDRSPRRRRKPSAS